MALSRAGALLLAAVLLPALSLSTRALAEKPAKRLKVAVLDVRATGGVDPKAVEGLSGLLASEAAKRPELQVTAGADIQAMIGFEKQRELLGCSDSGCLAEIGGALGVEFLVSSEVSAFGGTWIFTTSLVNISRGAPVARTTKEAASERELLPAAKAALAEVLDALGAGPSPAPAAAVSAPVQEQRSSLLPWTLVGVGGTAMIVGGIFYGGAWSHSGEEALDAEIAAYDRDAAIGVALLGGGAAVAILGVLLFPGDEPVGTAPGGGPLALGLSF